MEQRFVHSVTRAKASRIPMFSAATNDAAFGASGTVFSCQCLLSASPTCALPPQFHFCAAATLPSVSLCRPQRFCDTKFHALLSAISVSVLHTGNTAALVTYGLPPVGPAPRAPGAQEQYGRGIRI